MELELNALKLIRLAFESGYQMGQEDLKQGIFIDKSVLIQQFMQSFQEEALDTLELKTLEASVDLGYLA